MGVGFKTHKINSKAFMNGPLDKWRDLQLFDSSSKWTFLWGFSFYVLIHNLIVKCNHVVTFTLISILATDYIQKRRGQALLFSFEYNLPPNLISK